MLPRHVSRLDVWFKRGNRNSENTYSTGRFEFRDESQADSQRCQDVIECSVYRLYWVDGIDDVLQLVRHSTLSVEDSLVVVRKKTVKIPDIPSHIKRSLRIP